MFKYSKLAENKNEQYNTTSPDLEKWSSNHLFYDEDMQVIDTIEQNYWDGKFVPPPPRPPFLEESIAADGLTTCDLCTWAWQNKGMSLDDAKEFSWTVTLIGVSVLSAFLGAIIMIVVLKCRRSRVNNNGGIRSLCFESNSTKDTAGLNYDNQTSKNSTNGSCSPRSTNSGLWTWFSSRKNLATPDQLVSSHTLPVENHYTHMDDANYNPAQIDEASYAEVGNEHGLSETNSYRSGNIRHGGDNDVLIMQCPLPAIPTAPPHPGSSSSSYYSGLLTNTNINNRDIDDDERPYEIVDLKEMANHQQQMHSSNVQTHLLKYDKHCDVVEGITISSDYV